MGGAAVTVTSRGPAMLTYLVSLFTNAATIGQATPPVTVYDGPAVTEYDAPLKLYVGLNDPDAGAGENAYDSTQEWAALGRMARNENLVIHCCSEAWSGSDDIAAIRDSCTAITAAVEVLMQSDTSQFGGNVLYPNPGMTNVSSPQNEQTGKGVIVRQPFDLAFFCRIGG